MAAAKSTRLAAGDWIDAALDALARAGEAGVRVEVLARRLGVTKGSFYWHFKDREALLDAAVAAWAEGRVAAIRRQTQAAAPRPALLALVDLYMRAPNPKGLAVELAIRRMPLAARAVEAVDGERLARVAALFAGLGHADAPARALLFYAFLFGQSLLRGKDLAETRAAAARLVTS
ncbi:MAG: TetR/AcrR family transcriptional regulator [Tagaea sp.]|nr:TetR/AcrR family transcriptional regulator [Tagaea sp.]